MAGEADGGEGMRGDKGKTRISGVGKRGTLEVPAWRPAGARVATCIRTLSKLEPTGRCLHEASAALRRHVRTCVTRRTWRTGVSPILGAGNRARARLGQALSAHLARMSGAWCRVRLGHAPVGDTAPRPRVPDCRSCARRTQTHSSCAHCAGPAGQPVRTVTLAHGARVGRHAE